MALELAKPKRMSVTDIIEKDIKIKDLTQEKSAVESDLKSLRNTLVKMTKEIVDLSGELKVAKTDKDQTELVTKIESLTKASITELPGIEESIIFKLPKI